MIGTLLPCRVLFGCRISLLGCSMRPERKERDVRGDRRDDRGEGNTIVEVLEQAEVSAATVRPGYAWKAGDWRKGMTTYERAAAW